MKKRSAHFAYIDLYLKSDVSESFLLLFTKSDKIEKANEQTSEFLALSGTMHFTLHFGGGGGDIPWHSFYMYIWYIDGLC